MNALDQPKPLLRRGDLVRTSKGRLFLIVDVSYAQRYITLRDNDGIEETYVLAYIDGKYRVVGGPS